MMQIHKFPVETPPSFDKIANTLPEGFCLFDIETTGLSPGRSYLYLIGMLKKECGSWQLTQWFCESPLDEKHAIGSFADALPEASCLIHFNGRSFDLPYLKHKCVYYGIADFLSLIPELDLYSVLRPYRSLLSVSSMKQQDLEQLAGSPRTDDKSGKELIGVYREYLRTADNRFLEMLLRHNREDVAGMAWILPLLTLDRLFQGEFKVLDMTKQEKTVTLSLQTDHPLPVSFSCSQSGFCLSVRADSLTLSAERFDGTLKYFFPDYRNYYYLPDEDTAVHKSIGRYVERGHRIQATQKNCYQKKSGSYVLLPPGYACSLPVFGQNHRMEPSWCLYDDFSEISDFKSYAHAALQYVRTGKQEASKKWTDI
ncbi:ribonuclease H-like domain-containing protein [Ruminococcus sp. OA3]|uniref:ribonuclease H-like domain-containing protein n=1 Tax=Ruminococcus sp. OA3 TaxID=2914164 RepID=UPI001F06E2F7|nr:ribonuclease H-like domain-containing protein [Ruminococcus sp. OA3]MCH1983591.1 ribonuclease H-like domain-containing protein [Ruminococcus sp. OA3]